MLGTMEQRTEGIKNQTEKLIEQAYQRGYKAGREDGNLSLFDNEVELGRNEAWEAAKKIMQMNIVEKRAIFGEIGRMTYAVISELSASEAIEKIREYEKKKQEEDSKIRVGDEVVWTVDSSDFGVVTRIKSSENAMWIIKPDGTQICASICRYWKKTGHHFPEIAEVLKKMQEGKNETSN